MVSLLRSLGIAAYSSSGEESGFPSVHQVVQRGGDHPRLELVESCELLGLHRDGDLNVSVPQELERRTEIILLQVREDEAQQTAQCHRIKRRPGWVKGREVCRVEGFSDQIGHVGGGDPDSRGQERPT